ncbi:uncharacterized protein H6S33_001348 [Morchella sextelata]|uniref:uncharacterized protein n=1 Tax=Morchella sextelata TaxID=1174677 RepID=UPI001D056AD3|nr:uncharacterized protein H6S33_001348 [Morchella sextelata]KAH0609120.1 hypothetical protein H6S33_001348 [Morchella sextelata]
MVIPIAFASKIGPLIHVETLSIMFASKIGTPRHVGTLSIMFASKNGLSGHLPSFSEKNFFSPLQQFRFLHEIALLLLSSPRNLKSTAINNLSTHHAPCSVHLLLPRLTAVPSRTSLQSRPLKVYTLADTLSSTRFTSLSRRLEAVYGR